MACLKAQLSIALILSLIIVLFMSMLSSADYCPPNTPAPSKGGQKKPPHSSPAVVPANPSPYSKETCPRDTLKLAACANLLNDLVSVVIGTPPKTPCCTLIEGLADVEAAVCLCTALKANVLGLNLKLDVSLTLLLNYCGTGIPSGFQCA